VVKIVEKLLRAGEGRTLKRLQGLAAQVNAIEEDFTGLTQAQMQEDTERFKAQLADGEKTLDDLLPEAFAMVREAARRTLGQRHFDVQIVGGAALHLGNIAEMKTGEGKTLVATAPAFLNALTGRGVHVVTVNDYLAEYQSELMGRVYRYLGLSVGCILSQMSTSQRQEAYAADITYGTNNEFGFDFLRDNMAWTEADLAQRGHAYAIVDEVDSILIDEARTPLIISGPADQPTKWYEQFAVIATLLRRDEDYEVDEKKRTVGVLESGIARVEDRLGIDNLYESVNTPLVGFLNNAIKAKELFKRDKEYVVKGGEVLIVDEHTGRMLPGRRYNEGMHQAIEAKEHVTIQSENQTHATITLQNYFRMYEKLSGMTGTAQTEAAELMSIYKLGVIPIPTNRPMIRADQSDLIYKTEDAKYDAVVEDIADRHAKGQPVLVGTVSVEKSEHLSALLRKAEVPHEVLNAKQHEREATIVAQAGRLGAVTVATNMAGRGTDIMLGGNAEFTAKAQLQSLGLDLEESADEYVAALPEALKAAQESVDAEHDRVVDLGGLYVLGTERHESRRIDNQLRGRSGRQGDPGESRFYLSLQDDLLRLFNSGMMESVLTVTKMPDEIPIESRMVTRAIAGAQSQVESRNFEARKEVVKYDDVLNRQREVIYGERRRVLEGADLHEQIRHFISDVVRSYVVAATSEGFSEDWDLEQLWQEVGRLFPTTITLEDVVEEAGDRQSISQEMLITELTEDALLAYQRREEQFGAERLRQLEREVILSVLDRKWREHLYEMDYLHAGIGLRAMAQRDPLVEYQREGYQLFQAMTEAIKEESVAFLFNVQVEEQAPADGEEPVIVAKGLVEARRPTQLQYSAPTVDGDGGVEVHSENGTAVPAAAAASTAGNGTDSVNRASRRAAAKKKRRR
jgi:preprotein translocase subunit SecA